MRKKHRQAKIPIQWKDLMMTFDMTMATTYLRNPFSHHFSELHVHLSPVSNKY